MVQNKFDLKKSNFFCLKKGNPPFIENINIWKEDIVITKFYVIRIIRSVIG